MPDTAPADRDPAARNARLAADVQRLRAELADATRDYAAMAGAVRYSLRELGGLAKDQPGLVAVLENYDARKGGNADG